MNTDTQKNTVVPTGPTTTNTGGNTGSNRTEAAREALAQSNNPGVEIVANMVVEDLREAERDRVSRAIKSNKQRGAGGQDVDEDFRPHIRILGVFEDRVHIISVEHPYASWEAVSIQWVREMLLTRNWIRVSREPVALLAQSHYTAAQEKRRNRNKKILQPVIDLGDGLWNPDKLEEAVHKAAEQAKVTSGTVWRLVRRYLQAGLSVAGLGGRWRRGRVGVDGSRRRILCRASVRAGVKPPALGRKRPDGSDPFPVTEVEEDLILRGARQYCHRPLGGTWYRAWLLTIADYFLGLDMRKPFADLEALVKKASRDRFPSFTQFRYWARQDPDVIANLKRRHGSRGYNLKFRPLNSHTESSVTGPGQVFLIDATKLDVVCVHQITRRPIGRLTLYLVIDAFSRMIVGFYITPRNPGYDASSMAILSCAMDKVELCRSVDVTIRPEHWPCHCLAETFRGDGELATFAHHRLVERGIINVAITPAYRPDLKGLVESLIGALTTTTIHHLPGVSDGVRYRCQGNPDDLAVLDIVELNRIVIYWILQANNRVLKDYQLTKEMIAAGMVTPTPLELWNYGMANLTGRRRAFDDLDTLKMHCLPTANVHIGARGLVHDGLVYWPKGHSEKDSILPEFESWRSMARSDGLRDATITYNPDSVDEVWFHHGDRMIPMELAPESRSIYAGWTIADLQAFRDEEAAARTCKSSAGIPAKAMLELLKAHQVTLAAIKTEAIRGTVAERKKERTDKAKERESQQAIISGAHRPPRSPRHTSKANAAAEAKQRDDARLAAELKQKRTNASSDQV